MPLAEVSYQIGINMGTVKVLVEEDEDNDVIIAKAKKKVIHKFGGPMFIPTYYESWETLSIT